MVHLILVCVWVRVLLSLPHTAFEMDLNLPILQTSLDHARQSKSSSNLVSTLTNHLDLGLMSLKLAEHTPSTV